MSSPQTQQQTQQLLDKLEELRAVFVLGRRSVPFLEQLFRFVKDITVLLEEVDATIRAQTGDMPRATSRLRSVSEATELATNEILDLVDEALGKLCALEEHLEGAEASYERLGAADARLLEMVQDELGAEREALVARIERVCEEKRSVREEGTGALAAARETLAPIRANMNQIMMSLQVQDITAQQIASVNHLIESVRSRMNDLLVRFGTGHTGQGAPAAEDDLSTAAFDSGARYDHSSDRQQQADDLVASVGTPGAAPARGDGAAAPAAPTEGGNAQQQEEAPSQAAAAETASQADIDDMFSSYGLPGNAPDEEAAPAAGSSPESSSVESGDAESSGAEGAAGEVASQEDIDDLFQEA